MTASTNPVVTGKEKETEQDPFTLTPEQEAEFKARYIETADRSSYLNERLKVPDLPPHLHGEWHGTDDMSQANSMARGFVDGSKYVNPDNFMHQTVTGGVIGDVKFMVISKQKHKIMQQVDFDRAMRQGGIDRELDKFRTSANELGLGIIRGGNVETQELSGSEAPDFSIVKHRG